MTVARIQATLDAEIEQVWDMVTLSQNQAWRSDLCRIVATDGIHFTEITWQGYITHFTVTRREPFTQYELDLENARLRGYWTGLFRTAGNKTEVHFEERITGGCFRVKPLLRLFLSRQQRRYLSDLKRALKKISAGNQPG